MDTVFICKNDWQAKYIYSDLIIWQVFSQKIYRKKLSVSIQLIVFVANVKSTVFKQKLEFWKTCILHSELDSFPVPKDFFPMGCISECRFVILCNEMC